MLVVVGVSKLFSDHSLSLGNSLVVVLRSSMIFAGCGGLLALASYCVDYCLSYFVWVWTEFSAMVYFG